VGIALVDDVRGDRRLHDRLARLARPLAADVTLHGEHARLVIQFLGHVLAHALHLAAAGAGGALGFVADLGARQLRGQHLALRSVALTRRLGRLQLLDLLGHRLQVSLQRLFQEVSLLGAEALGLRGELQPLQDRILVRELLDRGLVEAGLGEQPFGQCTHLGFVQAVDVRGVAHEQ
jgi:hypothetical protein